MPKHFCTYCDKRCHKSEGALKCCLDTCDDRICETCQKDEQCYRPREWVNAKPQCDGCKGYMCFDDAMYCDSCANDGDGDLLIYCTECASERGYEYAECDVGHTWRICRAERANGEEASACGECQANRNYDGRYGVL